MQFFVNYVNFILQANSIWLYIVPQSMRSLMIYIKQKYGNPSVFITENGNIRILTFYKNSRVQFDIMIFKYNLNCKFVCVYFMKQVDLYFF